MDVASINLQILLRQLDYLKRSLDLYRNVSRNWEHADIK